MEIKDYYIVLKRSIWLVLLITAVFAVVSYLMTLSGKPTYQSSTAILIDRVPSLSQSEVSYYQYDNFYSQSVSASLSSSLIDYLSSASTAAKIFEASGYPLPNDDIRALSKIFTVSKKQESSSVINISYSSKDKTQAERIISSAARVLQDKVTEYGKNDSSAKFITVSDQPVVIGAPKQFTINVLIATFLGFVISLGLVSIREALK